MNLAPIPPGNGRRPRLAAFDGLRGVAAAAVMLCHLTAPPVTDLTPRLAAWTTYGQFGVELFFMISGFVIAMSLQGKSLWSFVVSRFIRLYPIFWVCIGFSWAVRTILVPTPEHISGARILANATMIPKQFLGIDSYLEGSYWTLEVELFFYVTCAVCWFASRRNPIIAILMGISLVNVAIDATDVIAKLPACPRVTQAFFMRAYGWLFVQFAHLFLIGVATYRRRQLGTWRYLGLLTFCIAVGVYHNRFTKIGDSANAVMTLAMILLFLGTALTPDVGSSWSRSLAVLQASLCSTPLLFLGRISYPLYLIHQGLGLVVLGRIHRPGLPASVGILVGSAVSIVAATFLTFCVDEPLRRRLTDRMLPASRAASA